MLDAAREREEEKKKNTQKTKTNKPETNREAEKAPHFQILRFGA